MNTEAGARRNEQRFLDPATLARLGSLELKARLPGARTAGRGPRIRER